MTALRGSSSSTARLMRLALICASLAAVSVSGASEARKHHHSKSLGKCQDKECELSQQHFALYSTIKRALESGFNLSGKEIVPMLRSVEILRNRFANSAQDYPLNGTDLVRTLLDNNNLKEALKVFNSDEGRELITLYRASVNGRGQNLACSSMRIEDLKRATARVESSWEFHNVFSKINKNFLKKSAKKCLKHSCTSIELAMTKLDSVLTKSGRAKSSTSSSSSTAMDDNSIQTDNLVSSGSSSVVEQQEAESNNFREFQAEELELCKFFKRTNATDCKIGGVEMANIQLEPASSEADADSDLTKSPSLSEYLSVYAKSSGNMSDEEAGKRILAQCRSMSPMLEYSLAPLKWYRERGLISDQKLASRAFWCKSLSYWMQVERLCGELESRLTAAKNRPTLANNQPAAATQATTTRMPASPGDTMTAPASSVP